MMTRNLILTAVACAAMLTSCTEATPPPPPAEAPRITSFKADKAQSNPGAAVKLTYEVQGASSLELVDETGAFIPLSGDVNAGEATVSPLRTHFYVLRAAGPGGRDSAFLQVAVGEPLKDVFLIAVPPTVNGGQTVQLLWGAPRNVSANITSTTGDNRAVTGDSGSETFLPKKTTTYTLVADPGTGAPKLSAAVQVEVKPVISSLTANPGAAHAGEVIKVSWKTAGGTRLLLSEATFGTMHDTADEAAIGEGSFDFTIPANLPSGVAVQDGLPLKFTLRVIGSSPEVQVARELPAYVGAVPNIDEFSGPSAVTEGGAVTLRWRTSDAVRVSIRAGGQPIYESLPGDAARVAAGAFALPAPSSDTTFELVATNALGVTASKSTQVAVVKRPTINSFTAPSSVPSAGGSATLSWNTTNAVAVTITTASGANVYSTTDSAKVASGTVDINVAQDTVFTLVALNAANDPATNSKTILAPAATLFFTDAGTALPDTYVFAHYDLSTLQVAQLAGIPDPNYVPSSGSTNFVDLSTKADAVQLSFANTADGAADFTPGRGFAFPFFGQTYRTFTVQVDGVVGFHGQQGAAADNVNLPSAPLGQALLPFWEQLQLGSNGRVRWWVDGAAFPRKLIISWTNLELSGVSGSDVSFQTQLFETGEFRFVYGTLTGSGANGEDATIGVSAARNGWSRQIPSNAGAAAVSAGTELTWFAPTNTSGTFLASFPAFTRMPFFALGATGRWMVVEGVVRVFGPDAITLSEAMPNPESGVASTGQWVELHNLSASPLDVTGLKLLSSTSTTGYELPPVSIPANGVLVVGQSTNPAETSGAPVQHVYTDVPISTTAGDAVRLTTGTGEVKNLAWSAPPTAGTSVLAPQPYAFTGDGGSSGAVAVTCANTQMFGTGSSFGSPGQPNPSCMKYRVEKIPSNYEDISVTGTPLFADVSSNDDQYVAVPLGGANGFAPDVTYFGKTYSDAWVSTDGWIAFEPQTSSNQTERLSPAAAGTVQGFIAPFWDDLDFERPASNVYARRVAPAGTTPGYVIVAWHDVQHFVSTPTNDVMEIEAKIFDNGVIEFHYGRMTSGTTGNFAAGTSATIWIEEPDAARALAIGRGQAVIAPYTAYRFIPVP